MPIRFEVDCGVAVVTIDRPETRNALDGEHYAALADAWISARDSREVRVVVVTGVESSFCAGADLRTLMPEITAWTRRGADHGEPIGDSDAAAMTTAVLREFDMPKPIIAAVNGHCVASGMEMLLGTDIRIASERARFGLPEVRVGLFASGGSTVRLPRQIPFPLAMEVLLTGDTVDAVRAERMGIVNQVVPHASVLDVSVGLARRIAENSPSAVRATKQSVMQSLGIPLRAAFDLELEIGNRVFAGPDAREGPAAFVEKRSPVWSED